MINLFKKPVPPTALQIAAAQLEEAKVEKLSHSKLREYHTSIEDMLTRRIERLKNDIYELSQSDEIPGQPK